MVERGQPFAKVGTTGLSTGPHLHWELWVNGANVDPIEWTERDMP
jgi:murein DD-endopeptidase MepM/ murein hydrolase activator NlpD